MLLPSDVARLVLGYLQEEGLSATSQAFIHESPNLKEYAEHTTGDGTIPACVFSIFGKSLTTILNEYVAAKTKESCHEVPVVMTSLWKKLDFTLNQIKSLQNSPAISACQRTRSRVGLANMARQRVLAVASAGGVVCSSVSETSTIISPAHTSHSMLAHSTPVCYSGLNSRPASGSGTSQHIHDSSRLMTTPRDSPVQIIVSEHRLNPGPMSPGRRKWDTPRKRSGALSGSSAPGRSATPAGSSSAEPQPEEVVDENFPQLVIQNARDKILGDRSLQEKLAENINKILANEPVPQTSKGSSSTVETDQSIDEILGLQGEIHMSDDAIHDILEQTESDPAFQALFDLFDCNKTKFTDGEAGDGDTSSSPEETDIAGPTSSIRLLQNIDSGATHSDSPASDTTPMTVKTKPGQERKTRKSAPPTLLKKTVLGPNGRSSRIENSSARLIVSQGDPRGVSSAPTNSNRKEKDPIFTNTVNETPMDIDEPLNTPPPPPLDSLATQEPPTKDSTSVSPVFGESSTVPSPVDSGAFPEPEETSASNMNNQKEPKQSQEFKDQPGAAGASSLPPEQAQLNITPAPAADLPQILVSNSGGDTLPVSTFSVISKSVLKTSSSTDATASAASPSSAFIAAPSTATPAAPTCASTSASPRAAHASFTAASPASSSSSCAPIAPPPAASVATTADLLTTSIPNTAATDSSNVMSLKIIISDNQDEGSSSDTALNQAISSISGDKIPTIYVSSPAKSVGCPETPKANMDEVAQAVSGLQRSEAFASPLSSKAGAVTASPLTGTSQAQQSYIIQLPLDATNPAIQGASYFLVTEPQSTEAEGRQVVLPAGVSNGQPLPTNQYAVTTPTRSTSYSTGSALVLPSPVKPMMLPVSVVGPNPVGKVQMVSSQLVAIQNPVSVEQTETVPSKTPTVASKQPAAAGTEKNLGSQVVQPVSAGNTDQQDAAKGASHRRILCFDPSADVQPQTAKTTTTSTAMTASTSPSPSIQQTEKTNTESVVRTRPTILGGNKPKRRVETVRCLASPQAGVSLVKEPFSLQQYQKDSAKKSSRKQDHNTHKQESQSASTSSADASKVEAGKKSESEKRSKSVERKCSQDAHKDNSKPKNSHNSRSESDSALKSGSRKDKEESSRKESAEKVPLKPREGRTEKKTPSQEMPNVTANKENEMKGSMQEQQQQSAASSSASRDLSPPAVTQPASQSQSKVTKTPSKTSSLAKQAAEMLQDIQGLKSPSNPNKVLGASSSDLPGTGSKQEAPADCPRTPQQNGKGKDGEGTPKHLMPPNTPDVPGCSPASEAGSENSINMAAHTLMILSRAAIARTGSPLKDSLRQEEIGEKTPTSSKNSKKRKQPISASSPPPKKESKRSPTKKKDRERKKIIDYFPEDLDVDKFLSSLHYDE
ncbi:protein NPAT isoform X1 [Oreochromis aureus]|uniref:Protein NPAT C-terminal domain-containing protein n=1 Tax=Oreochromis aureus TaxID=47969 RepID=A0A668VUU6_OREAU|nr:protein NPAT isoform X1 [Oreochromis aureus]